MDLKELKALLRLMEANDVEELDVEEGGRRIHLRRRSGQAPVSQMAMVPVSHVGTPASASAALPPSTPATPEATGLIPVQSPMVGTFYRAPAPGAEPYVKEGDLVHKGTVLCIIEAMKLMNEIEAEVKGRVVKILGENGQPVEFGQTLFLLEPV